MSIVVLYDDGGRHFFAKCRKRIFKASMTINRLTIVAKRKKTAWRSAFRSKTFVRFLLVLVLPLLFLVRNKRRMRARVVYTAR